MVQSFPGGRLKAPGGQAGWQSLPGGDVYAPDLGREASDSAGRDILQVASRQLIVDAPADGDGHRPETLSFIWELRAWRL